MAREFSTADAKHLLDIHKELSSQTEKLNSAAHRLRIDIKAAVLNMAGDSSSELLKTIPVEELSRHQKGIRIKSLQDAGFVTVEDVMQASEYKIAAINGISPEGAKQIKSIASEIAEIAKNGTKIRLSADEKNIKSTALVTA